MTEELKEEVRLVTGASIPCLAISSNSYEDVARYIGEYAWGPMQWMRDNVPPQVLVWRQSVGFEEYAMYVTDADGNTKILEEKLNEANVGYVRFAKTGAVYKPDDDFEGATVPYAVTFMQDYNCEEQGRKVLFILRDWHRFINANAYHVDRQMSLFEEILSGVQKNVFALCPTRWGSSANTEIPIELSHYIRHTRLELPDKSERVSIVSEAVLEYSQLQDYREALSVFGEREIESLADALGGMSRLKINDVLAMSLIKYGTLDVPFVLSEKSKAIKEAGFTLIHPSRGFESIGGLTPLKEWISMISGRFTTAAKEYGFTRNLRGLLLCGVPGCGKTAIAKAAAHEMNMNLMMVQATDLKGSLVGESEAKVHRLLDIAKAAAPLIVFVDEAEKLLGKSEGIHDGGAHDAVLGQFLTFMQEDDSGVFFVFTANNMEKFPPELVDRFEGRFFIDLPQPAEREDIINIHLSNRRFGQQDPEHFDVPELIRLTNKFSGRNIEDAIEEAMTMSFSDNMRPLEQADLKRVLEKVIPTSETKKDEIDGMRRYAEDGLVRVANDMPEDDVRSKTSPTTRVRI